MIDDEDRVLPGSMIYSLSRAIGALESAAREVSDTAKRAVDVADRVREKQAAVADATRELRRVVSKITPDDIAEVKSDVRQIARSTAAQAMIRAASRLKRIRERGDPTT